MTFEGLAGILVVVLTASLLGLMLLVHRKKTGGYLRQITAFQNLRHSMQQSIEGGKRLHISMGKSGILETTNASSLVGLGSLEQIARISMSGDRPVTATSGDGSISILSQDTIRTAYRAGKALDQYDPDQGKLTGITPFSYITGTLPVIRNEQVATNILAGNFGPEAALLAEAAEKTGSYTLAASDSLPAQAALYATASDALVGEEAFAISAYLQAGPSHTASIRVQDILRWAIIVFLLIGSFLKLTGL